jgi:hypothetical protein
MRSNKKYATVAVIHLIWLPYGIDLFESFITSYKKYSAGYDHTLILLFNGVQNEKDMVPYHEYAEEQRISYISYYKNSGFDITVYFWVAAQVRTDYFLFLNSYSKLLENNWLIKYVQAIKGKNVGVVSATGSYNSLYTQILLENSWKWENRKKLLENYRKYKLLIKTHLVYRFYFEKFPNPHVRTNAFIIERDIFLSIKTRNIINKHRAYLFESGIRSMSRQLEKQKLDIFIMDKNGNLYGKKEWPQSNIFWRGEQENLLVSDNQTEKYNIANPDEKKIYTFLAWGDNE